MPDKLIQQDTNSKGFTLIELLVVVAIIGALSAIALPLYRNYVDKAQKTVAISTLDTVRKALEGFHIDNQEYPQDPINYGVLPWEDASSRPIFTLPLNKQINNDVTNFNYNSATQSYTVTAQAKDRNQTLITLTPSTLSY